MLNHYGVACVFSSSPPGASNKNKQLTCIVCMEVKKPIN